MGIKHTRAVTSPYLRSSSPGARGFLQLAERAGLRPRPCTALLHLRQRLRQARLCHWLHLLQRLRQELKMDLHHGQETATQHLKYRERDFVFHLVFLHFYVAPLTGDATLHTGHIKHTLSWTISDVQFASPACFQTVNPHGNTELFM